MLEILISYESYDDGDGSPECEFIPKSLPKQTESTDSEKKVRFLLFFIQSNNVTKKKVCFIIQTNLWRIYLKHIQIKYNFRFFMSIYMRICLNIIIIIFCLIFPFFRTFAFTVRRYVKSKTRSSKKISWLPTTISLSYAMDKWNASRTNNVTLY